MKQIKFLLLALGLGFGGAVTAEEPNRLTDAEEKAGWQLLFDGKTLEGWNSWKGREALKEGAWAVKDGALSLTKRGGGDIYTAGAYENYELVLEWKTEGNSGIMIRVDPTIKGAIWHAAPEMQVNRENNPKALGSTSAGGLYALYEIEGPEKTIHPDGWNKVRIKMNNGKGEHWFNGKKIYEYQIGSDDWNARVQKSKFRKYPGFAKTAKGHIGLQDHGKPVSYRNIKLRAL
ncbi:MAG: DUF1080 domain-containing protein [Verrucomicrobiota bacterium]